MREKIRHLFRKISPFQTITGSFLLLILLGSFLLALPVSVTDPGGCSYLDALFTSCSAVCVTGLVGHNTATFWSPFGKGVILVLIQIGGLGLITIVIAAAMLSGRRIGLRQRSLMQNAVNVPRIGGIIRFTRFLLVFTVISELSGTVLLFPVFSRVYGPGRGAWKAVFHAVSAFCNAGFDLLGDRMPYASLTGYSDNILLNLVIMALIVIGGLGFLTWDDLLATRFRWRRIQFQTKLILIVSAGLIFLPAIFFFLTEYAGESPGRRILLSLFQSVTTRTAGFNTADLSSSKESTRLIMVLLMLVGGSPGSTAGGLKTTTFAVILTTFISGFRRRREVSALGRTIKPDLMREAFVLMIFYLGLLFAGTLFMSIMEDLPVLTCMFECASALGTVGLTLGITPGLGAASRVLLILFMFLGRVGGLTFVYAAVPLEKPSVGKLPEERVMIG